MSVEYESPKVIDRLIKSAEATTGESYSTLTEAHQALNNGYGQGGESKPEQEKTVDITENGTTEILPDEGKALSKVTVNVDVTSSGGEEPIVGITDFTDFWAYGRRSEIFDKVDTSNGLYFDHTFDGYDAMTRLPLHFYTENAQSMAYMLSGCSALTGMVQINTKNCKNAERIIIDCSKITELYLSDTSKIENWATAFARCTSLKKISKLNFSKAGYNTTTFTNCTALENVEFEGEILVNNNLLSFVNSSLLTVDCLVKILNALSDNTGLDSTYAVKIGTTNLNKLSMEQKSIALNKNISLT